MFLLDTVAGRVRVAFTDRHGGLSQGPRGSLNLGGGPGSPAAVDVMVSANLSRVAEAFGVSTDDVVRMRQEHGRGVAVVDGPPAAAPTADALVTRTPGPVLLARAADCVLVALADPVRGVAAVVHSGRDGTLAGVIPAAVEALRAAGAVEVRAWIGPRVCGACYEVPEALRDRVAAAVPATWSTTRRGTPGLDLGAGVRAQLVAAGATVRDLAEDGPMCTMESADLFSHRRQGQDAGRLGVAVQVQP